ncbi:Leucine-rich repeat protein SHOC-2 [Neochlamydia sp. EPS4]|uniref:leucine-rich repeat domain-containing protein n=1 Tax=Neochlamydia sp. EPS4 TaxID=1478175 RepID=UPI000583653C|nr:leucine-rich repeat domain-containing protein [Neochlamydia sp. EPS4]KIC75328.1 Leucine-rich repeat protein SHOC-2 [Neochlamydia sp. EPS4]
MIPSDPIPRQQTDFRTTVLENIEDAVSGELMTRAVTLFPCGHTFNEDTAIQCLARNKLCPLDRQLIESHRPNYTIRDLAAIAESHPLEEHKNEPSEEAVEHFLRAKQYDEEGNHEAAVEALLQSLRLSPTYEKAQAYLEFCLKRSSDSSSKPLSHCREKGKEKIPSSTGPFKEGYIELLFNLLEEPSIQENLALKKMLASQVEELIRQEGEELTEQEKISYQWTKNLLGENKKVREFALEKLQQIHPSSPIAPPPPSAVTTQALSPEPIPSLYRKIIDFHFPHQNKNLTECARILDQVYKIKPELSVAAKVRHIFEQVLTWAKSLSPVDFERENKDNEVFNISTYVSYHLNINRFLLWEDLSLITDYLSEEKIKALPLKEKGELLKEFLKEHGKDVINVRIVGTDFIDEVGLTLTFLPAEIGQLSQLQRLFIGDNQLTTVPAEIGQLSNLQQLRLNHNHLTVLPPEIGQLSKLETLDLQQNHLTTLPAEIGQLSELTWLNLQQNRFTTMPAEIRQLSKLEALDLQQNQLTAVPAEVWQLSQLKQLFLHQNYLNSLPAEIRQLSNLWDLELEQNRLTALPPEIGQLSKLAFLNVGQNQLTALPVEAWQLSQLKRLRLEQNHLTTLPAAIGQLSKLQTLELEQNHLAALPAEIGLLSQLTWLNLKQNHLTALPAKIGKLSKLEQLDLQQNHLEALPAEIGKLSKLEQLGLGWNQLASLPAEIGQLSCLRYLDLQQNRLTALPIEMRKLSQLGCINLQQNRLTGLPAKIKSLFPSAVVHC